MKIHKITAAIFALLLCVYCMSGCVNDNVEKPDSTFDYDALYATESTFTEETMKNYTKASFGYNGQTQQGYNGWYYGKIDDGMFVEVSASDGKPGNDVAFDGEVVSVTNGATGVRRYVYDGQQVNVTVCGRIRLQKDDKSVDFVAAVNGENVRHDTVVADESGVYFEFNATLNSGDAVDFCFTSDGASVACNPLIHFGKATDMTLYRLTSFGKYYGDVFPWYDEENNKLYTGFLWSDDARGGQYNFALEESDNMLVRSEVPEANNYDTWQRYKEGGMLQFLFDANKVVDRNKYAFGIRDNMVYCDAENDRMLIVAGAYYKFDLTSQTSDLVIYASDDIHGLGWTKPCTVVAAGYDKNLPECPTLMKIGNRWYVFVSVAYNTAHQVGPLQYWTGDADVDCMDVDWQSKDFAFVDGEDLCAARPIKVKDKVYMWGWIPRTYDTMPWAPWGGYLNLPREIVVRSDGSLGGRMDPGLRRKLDYGRVFVANAYNLVGNGSWDGSSVTVQDDKLTASGSFDRNMVRFTLDATNATECGAELVQDGKRYWISIVKDGQGTCMQVSSPDDAKHKLNSRIAVADDGKYDVMFTVDNGIIEFFVNDNYALTAHTAMEDTTFSLGFYSVGEAKFDNISVSKLAPYQSL